MYKLKAKRKDYDWIWPAHNGLPLYPDDYLNDYIALDEEIINGTAKVLAIPLDLVFRQTIRQFQIHF